VDTSTVEITMRVELFRGWRSMARSLVPEDFTVPQRLDTPRFWLEPLLERHHEQDYAAWMSSIGHILSTPGFVGWEWPPAQGMSPEENLHSVRRHARHFAARVGFTYAVFERGSGGLIGCVYVYPAADAAHDCEVRSWVRADRARLDRLLHDATVEWLHREWPFRAVLSHPREVT
jgi:hypothetical protein